MLLEAASTQTIIREISADLETPVSLYLKLRGDGAGNMDTCLAIRTMLARGDTFTVQAGAGIVADSDPPTEYQETVNKASAMLKAIEMAEQNQ